MRAFDDEGVGSYADVIRGLQWVVDNRSTYNIRVLNLSFSAPPQSHYWDDPLNQAVMAAWKAGIVVVASAGNTGPDPMTIGVPGNVPYIITAGAMTDDYSPTDGRDDRLTSFSSAGPTYEAFVKPEVVAPGGHIRGLMKNDHRIVNEHSAHYLGNNSFEMSGTSQSAAVVSGIVALMIDQDPGLTPDEVKYRIMAAARPAVDDNGDLAYTIFQQGAGMVNAYDAVHPTLTGYANQGLDINADLSGSAHFQGRANRDVDGNYYIEGLSGYMWNDGFMWNDSYPFDDDYVFSSGLTESMSNNRLAAQCPPPLDVQRLVNRLVRDPHRFIVGILDPEPMGDLLRAPRCRPMSVLAAAMTSTTPGAHVWARHGRPILSHHRAGEVVLHVAPEPIVRGQLGSLRALGTSVAVPLRSRRPIRQTAAPSRRVATQLT